ncbi:hypothetical protein GCM10009624_11120 [Gordonia sinesedis]
MSPGGDHPGGETQWTRPDPRTPLAAALMLAAAMLAGYVPIVIANLPDRVPVIVGFFVAGVVVLAGTYIADVVRIRHTGLAIDDERVRYRFEFVTTKHASVPRERIRTVEVTADPAQRLLGLATLTLGSGEKDGRITVRALDRRLAQALRTQLLARPTAPPRETGTGTDRDPGAITGTAPDASATVAVGEMPTGAVELARWRPGWIRYAPLSFWTFVFAGAAFGIPMQVASWFDASATVWDRVTTPVRATGLVVGILVIVAIALIIGTVAAVVLHAEAWWGYRLQRSADGTLHVERGLLVRRSTTFEGRRIRGAVLVEPLGTRLAGGARIDLIALGLGTSDEGKKAESSTVLPDAPRAVADTVFAALTGRPVPERLVAHPPAAKTKRLRWAAAAVGVVTLVAVLVVVWTPVGWWLIVLAVALSAPAAGWLAVAAYAALGHALTDRHVYIRYGALRRATHALRRDAVMSWNVSQSVFQRRAGLASIGATTAADQPVVVAPDVGLGQARGVLADSDRPLWEPLLPAGTATGEVADR